MKTYPNHLSPIVTDITSSYLVDPYKEQAMLFDLQIPHLTNSYDQLLGEVVSSVEAY